MLHPPERMNVIRAPTKWPSPWMLRNTFVMAYFMRPLSIAPNGVPVFFDKFSQYLALRWHVAPRPAVVVLCHQPVPSTDTGPGLVTVKQALRFVDPTNVDSPRELRRHRGLIAASFQPSRSADEDDAIFGRHILEGHSVLDREGWAQPSGLDRWIETLPHPECFIAIKRTVGNNRP